MNKSLFAIITLFLTIFPFCVSAVEASKEGFVKAVFIQKFTHFIDWPDLDNQMVVCAYGQSETGKALENIVKSQKIKNFHAEFKMITPKRSIRACHILYIPKNNELNYQELRTLFSTTNLLTITDSPELANLGAIINFLRQGEKLRFEINLLSAKKAELKISSRLLKLATHVERGDEK